jgi:hypothetical protein
MLLKYALSLCFLFTNALALAEAPKSLLESLGSTKEIFPIVYTDGATTAIVKADPLAICHLAGYRMVLASETALAVPGDSYFELVPREGMVLRKASNRAQTEILNRVLCGSKG